MELVESSNQAISVREMLASLTGAQRTALRAFQEAGNVTSACKAAGINRTTFHNWRKNYPVFNELADMLYEAVYDNLEETALNRAQDGSDSMLQFMLKAHRAKYRDQGKDSSINVAIQVQQFSSNE